MNFQSIIAPKNNVYYKCKYLYPEMFFVMLALNELVKLRIKGLVKSNSVYNVALDKNIIWDDKVATIRSFQGEFMNCVKEVLTEGSFNRWLKLMNGDYIDIKEMAGQYLDLQNINYINMTREKRLKNLSKIAKQIAQFRSYDEYDEIKAGVAQAAKEHNCCENDISFERINYPDEIEW